MIYEGEIILKKIISLLLCVLLLVGMFTACDKTMTMEEILKDTTVVMGKAGKQDIHAYELLYLMSMGYDAETAFEEISSIKIMQQKAMDSGIALTEEEIKAADEELNAMIEQYGGQEAFDEILSQFGLTFEQYKSIMDMSNLVTKFNGEAVNLGIFEEVTEEQAKAYFDGNFIKAKHILFTTQNPETGEALPEEEINAKMALAEDTLNKIKAGADFDSFASLNEDPGSASMPDGYVFAVTSKVTDTDELSTLQQAGFAMVAEFEAAADALEIDAVSDLVQTSYGAHIIKRVAMTDADYEANKTTIINILNNAKYLKKINEWKEDYKIKKNEKMIASINMEEFQAIMAAKAEEKAAQQPVEETPVEEEVTAE